MKLKLILTSRNMTKIPKTNFTFDLKHFLKKRSHVKTCVPSLKKYKTTKTKF